MCTSLTSNKSPQRHQVPRSAALFTAPLQRRRVSGRSRSAPARVAAPHAPRGARRQIAHGLGWKGSNVRIQGPAEPPTKKHLAS